MSNWSDLPTDLLTKISNSLPSLSDFIRFRSVCSAFRSSATLSSAPPQLPFLLQHRDPSVTHNSTSLQFFSLSSNTVHTVTCAESDGKWLKGPTCNYLLASHCMTDQMSLLNPFTHREIPLPFLDLAAAWPDWISPDLVVVSGDPLIVSGDAFYTDVHKRMLAFCRPGDEKWVTMQEGFHNSAGHLYFDGMYFAVDRITGITKIIDLALKSVLHVVPPAEAETHSHAPLEEFTYLVESNGDILRVVQYLYFDLLMGRDFDIHRLDIGDKSVDPCWVKIDGIGDRMLFLDMFHGFKGLSFRASDFVGFGGNCIYFLKEQFHDCILCKYEIENGTIEELPCPFEQGGTWIVPSLC